MFHSTEKVIVIVTTIISTLIAIVTIIIAGYVINHFANPPDKKPPTLKMRRASMQKIITKSSKKSKTKPENIITKTHNNKKLKRKNSVTDVDIANYFKYSASILFIFNAGCSLFNAVYSIHMLVDPHNDDNMFYVNHPSHYFRIISTICWYIGTIALIWFFNGRLFFAFKSSSFSLSKTLFYGINIFVTVSGFISIVVAYFAVYKQNLLVAEISFNSFRVLYLIITFILLYMFSKRLLLLIIQEQSQPLIRRPTPTPTPTQTPTRTPTVSSIVPSKSEEKESETVTPKTIVRQHSHSQRVKKKHSQKVRLDFLQVTARNSVLVFITSTSVALVTFFWCSFRFIFLPQTRLTLLIPMNMASIDSIINSICVIMMIPFGYRLYRSWCGGCNQCFMSLCLYAARRKRTSD